MNGDIPQPRFGHSFTMISKTKAVLFGGAVSIGGTHILNICRKISNYKLDLFILIWYLLLEED